MATQNEKCLRSIETRFHETQKFTNLGSLPFPYLGQ